jgi:hypothetical protein
MPIETYSKNLDFFRLRYRSVTVTVIDRRLPIPYRDRYRYYTVTDRPPLPTITDRYPSLPLLTVPSNGNGE